MPIRFIDIATPGLKHVKECRDSVRDRNSALKWYKIWWEQLVYLQLYETTFLPWYYHTLGYYIKLPTWVDSIKRQLDQAYFNADKKIS